jgi:hypothetical protein
MVGRTRLIRTTGSPLIGGWTRPVRKVWRWIALGAAVLAAAVAVWYFFLR